MKDVNETIKTYGICLFWMLASGCAGFLIGYLIGYNNAPYYRGYPTEALEMDYALNGGLIGAAIGVLAALAICGIVIWNIVRNEQIGVLPPRTPREE